MTETINRQLFLYRAWIPATQKMEEVLALRLNGKGGVTGLLLHSGEYYDAFVLMEAIGIQDTAGKNIFECDIVEVPCETEFGTIKVKAVIAWWNESARYTYDVPPPGVPLGGSMQELWKCRIIGNILENPTLLPLPETYQGTVSKQDEMSSESDTPEV